MKGWRPLHLLSYASDLAAAFSGSASGPSVLRQSDILLSMSEKGLDLRWGQTIAADKSGVLPKATQVTELCQRLATAIEKHTRQKEFFLVLGGDHTSAIGTWSGAATALSGALGLIWIDAHMDSHTPHTSLTGNIHGMPLASLLGYGMPSLTSILSSHPKIKPEHLCLIGVRSFERGEAALLKELNVRIFFMEEVRQRGLKTVLKEAISIVTKDTAGFGISLDVDGIDPKDAPGTGVTEPNGISAKDMCQNLQWLVEDPHLIGAEIVEFDPSRDQKNKTEMLVSQFIATFALGSHYHDVIKSCCQPTADVDL
jgi:arginase